MCWHVRSVSCMRTWPCSSAIVLRNVSPLRARLFSPRHRCVPTVLPGSARTPPSSGQAPLAMVSGSPLSPASVWLGTVATNSSCPAGMPWNQLKAGDLLVTLNKGKFNRACVRAAARARWPAHLFNPSLGQLRISWCVRLLEVSSLDQSGGGQLRVTRLLRDLCFAGHPSQPRAGGVAGKPLIQVHHDSQGLVWSRCDSVLACSHQLLVPPGQLPPHRTGVAGPGPKPQMRRAACRGLAARGALPQALTCQHLISWAAWVW